MTHPETWFVLKEYLELHHVPAIIFQDEFKTLLRKRIQFDEQDCSYEGYTSKHLPLVREFSNFWETNMIASNDARAYIDVDELIALFRKGHPRVPRTRGSEYFVSLIKCFYPGVSITQQRIVGFRNALWDKNQICRVLAH